MTAGVTEAPARKQKSKNLLHFCSDILARLARNTAQHATHHERDATTAAFASLAPSRPMILFDHDSVIIVCVMVLHYSGFNNQSYEFLDFRNKQWRIVIYLLWTHRYT